MGSLSVTLLVFSFALGTQMCVKCLFTVYTAEAEADSLFVCLF